MTGEISQPRGQHQRVQKENDMGVKTTIKTSYIIEQSEEGKKLAEELKDRNKGFVTKFKESTTTIIVETTYSVEIGE